MLVSTVTVHHMSILVVLHCIARGTDDGSGSSITLLRA